MIDSNGTTLAEYWHSGGLHDLIVADLEGNGKQEIIATGVAHGYDSQATVRDAGAWIMFAGKPYACLRLCGEPWDGIKYVVGDGVDLDYMQCTNPKIAD
ncbi:MAG TPA: hypothetical protein VGF82_24450 [Terracidiphilus sp.]